MPAPITAAAAAAAAAAGTWSPFRTKGGVSGILLAGAEKEDAEDGGDDEDDDEEEEEEGATAAAAPSLGMEGKDEVDDCGDIKETLERREVRPCRLSRRFRLPPPPALVMLLLPLLLLLRTLLRLPAPTLPAPSTLVSPTEVVSLLLSFRLSSAAY